MNTKVRGSECQLCRGVEWEHDDRCECVHACACRLLVSECEQLAAVKTLVTDNGTSRSDVGRNQNTNPRSGPVSGQPCATSGIRLLSKATDSGTGTRGMGSDTATRASTLAVHSCQLGSCGPQRADGCFQECSLPKTAQAFGALTAPGPRLDVVVAGVLDCRLLR